MGMVCKDLEGREWWLGQGHREGLTGFSGGRVCEDWGPGTMVPSPAPSPSLVARPAWAPSCGGNDGSPVVKLMLGKGQAHSSDSIRPPLISFSS